MKNIIAKAIWCMPLWGVFAFIYALTSAMLIHYSVSLNKSPDTDMYSLYYSVPDMLYIFLEKLTHTLYFAGQMALLCYLVERTSLAQARFAMALLFVAQCFLISPIHSTYFKELFSGTVHALNMERFERDVLFYNLNIRMVSGTVNFLTGIPGTLLLWYSLYKSKLFSNTIIVLYICAITVYFGLTYIIVSTRFYHYAYISTLTGALLAITAGYATARQVKFDNPTPVPSTEPLS